MKPLASSRLRGVARLLTVLAMGSVAFGQLAPVLRKPSEVIGSGGTSSSGSNFQLVGTIGQAVADAPPIAGGLALQSGFWHSTRPRTQSPGPEIKISDVRSGMEVRFSKSAYRNGDAINAELDLGVYRSTQDKHVVMMISPRTRDVEMIVVERAADGVFRNPTPKTLRIRPSAPDRGDQDGILDAMPGENLVAIWYVNGLAAGSAPPESLVSDTALAIDKLMPKAPQTVNPQFAMTKDEKSPPPGGKRAGTLASRTAFPVQIALDELVFVPSDDVQRDRFFAQTKGKIVRSDLFPDANNTGKKASRYLVKVNNDDGDPELLAGMRKLLGQTSEVLASSDETLKIAALAVQLQMDGYAVAVNPRMQYHTGPMPLSPETGHFTWVGNDLNIFDTPKVWGLMGWYDKETNRIRAAFLDLGFNENPDFRQYVIPRGPGAGTRGFIECDFEGAGLADPSGIGAFRCGPGVAMAPPSVGGSLFGDLVWHGNGVVSVAGGAYNNRWGTAGTGGQVLEPMLYRMGAVGYAFEMGLAIDRAVADGASLINLSAGIPTRIFTEFGLLNIESRLARHATCALLTSELALAAEVACGAAHLAAVLLPPPFGQIAAEAVCFTARSGAIAASALCFEFARLPLIEAASLHESVRNAARAGVPLIVSAGNRFTSEDLPEALRPFVNLDVPMTVENWRILPAVFEECITVGATLGGFPFANHQVWGSVVDVWAPEYSSYLAPTATDRLYPATSHVRHRFSGTSSAAPYVSGIVADIMAVNPMLNPATPGLTSEQRARIPATISRILRETSYTFEQITNRIPTDEAATESLAREMLVRPRLIHPLAAVERAAFVGAPPEVPMAFINEIAGFWFPRFTNSFNYGYDEAFWVSDDEESTVFRFDERGGAYDMSLTSHSVLPVGSTTNRIVRDIDFIRFPVVLRSPRDNPTNYLWRPVVHIDVADTGPTLPVLFTSGSLLGESEVRPRRVEREDRSGGQFYYEMEFELPEVFYGTPLTVSVRLPPGDPIGTNDIGYTFSVYDHARGREVPRPDPCDSGGVTNDTPATACVVDVWRRVGPTNQPSCNHGPLSRPLEQGFYTLPRDYNFHRLGDIDLFRIDLPILGADERCVPSLSVCAGTNSVRLQLLRRMGDRMVVLASGLGRVQISADVAESARGNLFVEATSAMDGRPLSYSLEMAFAPSVSSEICTLAERLRDIDEAAAAGGGSRSGGFGVLPGSADLLLPSLLPGIGCIGPGEFGQARGRCPGPDGLVVNPEVFGFSWSGGDFSSAIRVASGHSLQARIVDLAGRELALDRTSDLMAGVSRDILQNRGRALPGSPRPQADPPPSTRNEPAEEWLNLSVAGLPKGTYFLFLSHMQPETEVSILLPQGAVTDGSPTLEQWMTPRTILPTAPILVILKLENAIEMNWNDSSNGWQLQEAVQIGAGAEWRDSAVETQWVEGRRRVRIATTGRTSFYRLRSQ